MTRFDVHTQDSAPLAARPLLEGAKQAFGFVPNLIGILAEAPATAEAYLALGKILGKTSLSPVEQQVVLITTSVHNGCSYCVAAHSVVADMLKAPVGVVDALRRGTALPDPKLEALRRYTVTLIRTAGFLEEGDLDQFLAAGYTKAQALEVLVGIAMKTISNYTNHVADTPLDPQFAGRAWEGSAAIV